MAIYSTNGNFFSKLSTIKNKIYRKFIIYMIAIALGIISGVSDISLLKNIGTFVSDIFTRIFHCLSLPIIALSLIVTLSSYNTQTKTKRIWKRIIIYTLSTTIIAASVSCALYLIINPSNINNISQSNTSHSLNQPSYLQHLSSLIPSNIFAPFIDYQVITVLLLGIIVGIAIRYIPDQDPQKSVISFFKGAHGIFMVITKWVISIIPIGLYGFMTVTVAQIHNGMSIIGIGQYLSVIVMANLIQGFIILPTWLKINSINPFKTLHNALPALSIAFFSKSSTGTLPITIEAAENNLGIHPRVSRLVLPLCTSINMNGCAAFIFTTVIYLMQNQGIEITFSKMLIWIIISTIAAIGNAGVPMGCFFLSISLLSSINIPFSIMGLILPFYNIIDMLETSLNVWSDTCVAKVINDKLGRDIEFVATQEQILENKNKVIMLS